MRTICRWLVPIAGVAALGCAPYWRLTELEQRQKRFESDMVRFYENVADAYFLIGWEYFELAQELEEQGKTEASQKYAHRARLFSEFSKEMKKNAFQKREWATGGFFGAADTEE